VNALENAVLKAMAGEWSVNPKEVSSIVAASGVRPSDFVDQQARRLFEAMMAQLGRGAVEFLDPVTLLSLVGDQVPRDVVVDIVAGRDLGQLSGRLRALRDAAARRELLEVLRNAANLLKSGSTPLTTVISEVKAAVDGIATSDDTIRPYSSDVVTVLDKLEAARRGDFVGVVPTGIEAFDAYLGGLQPSVLTFIGSLPSVGKSALVASICRNLGQRGVRVGFLSLEDSREWLVRRVASELSGVPLFTAVNRPRDLTVSQLERYGRAMEQAYPSMETIIGEDAEHRPLSLSEVLSRATTMVMRHGCKVIVIDHLGEISVGRTERHDLDILEVVVALRSLAKTHKVPVVVAAHLRRRTGLMEKSDRPVLTDFAFSAGIERVARVALGLYRPGPETLRVAILKQTQGVADVEFDLELNNSSATVKNTDRTGARNASGEIYADREVPS
jgi:replicative DNA helicase